MKFSIKDFFSKCDQIISFLQIWSHLLKKSLMENFIFCAVKVFDKFIDIIQNRFTLNLDKFKSFGRKDKLLDDFYLHVLGIQKYKELAYIIKIKLTLSYGQAAVERGFSVGKSYLECQYEQYEYRIKCVKENRQRSHELLLYETIQFSNQLTAHYLM